MKSLVIAASCIFLFGCALGDSSEEKRAEKLLTRFDCKNVELQELPQSSINTFHQQALAASKEKAKNYIAQYKAGETDNDIPLDDFVKRQYQRYHDACQALGGISSDI